MSYVVQRKVRLSSIQALARMCEMRKVETSLDGMTFAQRSRDELLSLLGDKQDALPLHLRKDHERMRVMIDRGEIQSSFDSDYLVFNTGRLTIAKMLFNQNDMNVPGDAYLQAAMCEEAESQGYSFEVETDIVGGDGVLSVGDVVINVEATNSEAQAVGGSSVL